MPAMNPTSRPVYTIDRSDTQPANDWRDLIDRHTAHEEITAVECHVVAERFYVIKLPPRIVDPDGAERLIRGSRQKCEMAMTAWEMEQRILQILDHHYPDPGAALFWLSQPRTEFQHRTGADLIRSGSMKQVLDLLLHLSDTATANIG